MADSDTHETKIVINGDSSAAVGALKRVVTALHSVRSAASKLMSAFGVFGMAVQGVQSLIRGFQWLKEKITETAREIAKIKWDFEMRNAANETARLVGWHEKLAKLMKDELDTLSKQRTIQGIDEQGRRDYEEGKREADRARQIYEAKTPEEEQALRDRFAAEDEQRERENRKEQRKQQIKNLDNEESVYTSKAKSLRNNNADIEKQLKIERFNLERATGYNELAEPIAKRISELEQRFSANDKQAAIYEKEAKFRRDQIAALEKQKDYEGVTAGEWNRKTEAKKRAEEEARERAEAEDKTRKDIASAAADRLNAENAAKLDQARDLDSFAGRLAAQEGVSTNRLSAMGLGSGVQGGSGVASDVKRLVTLLEEEVRATKENKPGDAAAVYGD